MASALAKTVNKGAGASVSNNISYFHKHISETIKQRIVIKA